MHNKYINTLIKLFMMIFLITDAGTFNSGPLLVSSDGYSYTKKNVTREKAENQSWRCTSNHRRCLATLKKKIDGDYTPGKQKHNYVHDKCKIKCLIVLLRILDQLLLWLMCMHKEYIISLITIFFMIFHALQSGTKRAGVLLASSNGYTYAIKNDKNKSRNTR